MNFSSSGRGDSKRGEITKAFIYLIIITISLKFSP